MNSKLWLIILITIGTALLLHPTTADINSHSFRSVDIRDFVNFTFDQNNFVFNLETEKESLSLSLCGTYNNIKYNLSNFKTSGFNVVSKIESNSDRFKFGWNITTGTIIKTNINSICLETDKPVSYDDSNWYFGDYSINFDDLKEAGFDIKLTNTTLTISNIVGKELWFDPVITFTTGTIEGIAMTTLGGDRLAIVWCDEVSDTVNVSLFYTNGTRMIEDIFVDSGGANTCQGKSVGIAPINSSAFGIVWANGNTGNLNIKFFDVYGSNLTDTFVVQNSGVGSWGNAIAFWNTSQFVVVWNDATNSDLDFQVLDWSNNAINSVTNRFVVDWNIGTAGVDIGVAILNDSAFVLVSSSTTGVINQFSVFSDTAQTLINKSFIDPTTNVGLSVSALNSSDFVIGYANSTLNKVYVENMYAANISTFESNKWDNKPSNRGGVDISAINDTGFIIVGVNPNASSSQGGNVSAVVYDVTGEKVYIPITDNATLLYVGVTSYNQMLNLSVCDDVGTYFVVGWAEYIYSGNFSTYYTNGTAWDGSCTNAPTMCNPTINVDWIITDSQTCSTDQDIGTGSIIINTGGSLTLISNADVTANSIQLNKAGDSVFINSGSELRVTV